MATGLTDAAGQPLRFQAHDFPRLFTTEAIICVRSPVLRVDPSQRRRLEEIRDNLTARIAEAQREGWRGEAENLGVSLAHANDKLTRLCPRSPRRDHQPRHPHVRRDHRENRQSTSPHMARSAIEFAQHVKHSPT
jgi:hypothetical protein